MKSVLITGASTGIGRATTLRLASAGYRVFACVRRDEDLRALRAADPGQGEIRPILMDVTDTGGIEAAHRTVTGTLEGEPLAGLVNNAGIVVAGPLQHLPTEDLRRQMEVNFFGVFEVTRAFLPLLIPSDGKKGTPGRIINLSSVSGLLTFPFLGPYCASKYALESLSDALRRELRPTGVRVSLIEPGPIRTPIWEKARGDGLGPYDKTEYADVLRRLQRFTEEGESRALPAEAVARVVQTALESPRPRIRYPVVRSSFTDIILPKFIPAALLDRLIASRLRWG